MMTGDRRSLSIESTGAKARPPMPADLNTMLGDPGEVFASVAQDAKADDRRQDRP